MNKKREIDRTYRSEEEKTLLRKVLPHYLNWDLNIAINGTDMQHRVDWTDRGIMSVTGSNYGNSLIGIYEVAEGWRGKYGYSKSEVMPIMRRMDTLHLPFNNGEIPLIELCKMGFSAPMIPAYKIWIDEERIVRVGVDNDIRYNFWFIEIKNNFMLFDLVSRTELPCYNVMKMYDYLFEHHFDVYGLIDKDLALDLETFKLSSYD